MVDDGNKSGAELAMQDIIPLSYESEVTSKLTNRLKSCFVYLHGTFQTFLAVRWDRWIASERFWTIKNVVSSVKIGVEMQKLWRLLSFSLNVVTYKSSHVQVAMIWGWWVEITHKWVVCIKLLWCYNECLQVKREHVDSFIKYICLV